MRVDFLITQRFYALCPFSAQHLLCVGHTNSSASVSRRRPDFVGWTRKPPAAQDKRRTGQAKHAGASRLTALHS